MANRAARGSSAKADEAKTTGEGAAAQGETLKPATKIELGAATMFGDMRDHILDVIRLLEQPWSKMKAHEQRQVVGRVERISRESIRAMVSNFASLNIPSVEISIEGLSVKGEDLVSKVKTPKSDEAALLMLNAGRAVLVFMNPADFMGEREAAAIDPDQPNIPFPTTDAGGDALSPDEAEAAFKASNEAAAEKQARRGRKSAAAPADAASGDGAGEGAGEQPAMPDAPRQPAEA